MLCSNWLQSSSSSFQFISPRLVPCSTCLNLPRLSSCSHLIATHVGIEKSLTKWKFHVFYTQLFRDIYGNQLALASSCVRWALKLRLSHRLEIFQVSSLRWNSNFPTFRVMYTWKNHDCRFNIYVRWLIRILRRNDEIWGTNLNCWSQRNMYDTLAIYINNYLYPHFVLWLTTCLLELVVAIDDYCNK